jgi:K+-sensing histidine kinase KdpD
VTTEAKAAPEALDEHVPWENFVKFVRQLSHDLRNQLNAAELQSALIAELTNDAELKSVKWEVLPADGTLNIDPELTEWAAAELFRNAFRHDLADDEVQAQASVEGDWFTLSIREAKKEEIDPAQWAQPLQKMSHGHYGLGLRRARRIIAALGGELSAKFDPASRTLTSTITLPCSTESS